MGFDLNSTRLILLAKRQGVDFSRTLVLGRQSLNLGLYTLERLLKEAGIRLSDAQRQTVSSTLPHADGLLKVLGAETLTTLDASSYEGASVIHDMNTAISESIASHFTLVIDFGTLEHIFNFPVAVQNCMRFLSVGGSFLSATTANNYLGHGFYQFSPELFFRVFSKENGFKVEYMYLSEDCMAKYWYEVPDPAVIESRVELRNSLPTLMLVRARKIAEVTPFCTAPQQSDYEQALWKKNGAGSIVAADSSVLRQFGQRWAPDWVRNLRRGVLRAVTSPFSAPYFRRVKSRFLG
jgi:hypothetical protein